MTKHIIPEIGEVFFINPLGMEKIELGKTRELTSCIGVGTMYFESTFDENVTIALLDKYAEFVGSFLDTANKYASWIPGLKGISVKLSNYSVDI